MGKQQSYEKLDKMMTNHADETEISFLIDSLKVNFCFEIIEMVLVEIWSKRQRENECNKLFL